MKQIVLLSLLGARVLWSQQSISFNGVSSLATGSFETPTVTTGALRLEFRMHGFPSATAKDETVVHACNQHFTLLANQNALRLIDWTTPGNSNLMRLNGLNDVIIRVQHLLGTATSTFEMWSSDGRTYTILRQAGRTFPVDCTPKVTLGNNEWLGSGYYTGNLAYFRWFNSTVAEGTPPSTSSDGASLAYDFRSGASVTTGKGTPLQFSRNVGFVATPVQIPLVRLNPVELTASVNETVSIDTASTFSTAPIANWNWQQVSGPSALSIASAFGARPSVSGFSIPGIYAVQATVRDTSGVSSSTQVKIAVVRTNAQGVVQVDDKNVSFVLGPMVRQGMSKWPFYDELRANYGRIRGTEYPTVPPGEDDYRSGKVVLTTNSSNIIGSGTQFISDFMEPVVSMPGTVSAATGATAIVGSGTDFFRAFLKDFRTASGTINIPTRSNVITGVNTRFTSTAVAGGYLVVNTTAFRIARVVDDKTIQLERPWTGGTLSTANYQTASDAGLTLVITDTAGKQWLSEPIVSSPKEMGLRTVYQGLTHTSLRVGTTRLGKFDTMIVHYPTGSGSIGRLALPIKTVVSDSSIVLYSPHIGSNYRLVGYGRAHQEAMWNWVEGVNYYDNVLCQYQNYYRSGQPVYLDYARKLADAWYVGFDSGRSSEASPHSPRNLSLAGLMLRAMDGRPDMWPLIRRAASYNLNLWTEMRRNYPSLYYGAREGGFSLLDASLLAKIDPDITSRTAFKARVQDVAVNYFGRLQLSDGSWRWSDSNWTGMGEQPFHIGILLEGLIKAYRVTGDARIHQVIRKSVDHIITVQQPAPCRGPIYALYVQGGNWGESCPTAFSNPTTDAIRDIRAGNNTIMQAVGFMYATTAQTYYRDAGDNMFAATFGFLRGPLSDQYWGRADQDTKQYGQSFRTADAYLAYRTLTVTDMF